MTILTLRTDKPEAEIALFNNEKKIDEIIWHGHRDLGATIHKKIKKILDDNDINYANLNGIIAYRGPGSFTGLRIGLTVLNTLASELNIAIVGESGTSWKKNGLKRLLNEENEKIVLPNYGKEPHITKQKR